MITGMIINLVIGLACYAGFVLWRGKWVLVGLVGLVGLGAGCQLQHPCAAAPLLVAPAAACLIRCFLNANQRLGVPLQRFQYNFNPPSCYVHSTPPLATPSCLPPQVPRVLQPAGGAAGAARATAAQDEAGQPLASVELAHPSVHCVG